MGSLPSHTLCPVFWQLDLIFFKPHPFPRFSPMMPFRVGERFLRLSTIRGLGRAVLPPGACFGHAYVASLCELEEISFSFFLPIFFHFLPVEHSFQVFLPGLFLAVLLPCLPGRLCPFLDHPSRRVPLPQSSPFCTPLFLNQHPVISEFEPSSTLNS